MRRDGNVDGGGDSGGDGNGADRDGISNGWGNVDAVGSRHLAFIAFVIAIIISTIYKIATWPKR